MCKITNYLEYDKINSEYLMIDDKFIYFVGLHEVVRIKHDLLMIINKYIIPYRYYEKVNELNLKFKDNNIYVNGKKVKQKDDYRSMFKRVIKIFKSCKAFDYQNNKKVIINKFKHINRNYDIKYYFDNSEICFRNNHNFINGIAENVLNENFIKYLEIFEGVVKLKTNDDFLFFMENKDVTYCLSKYKGE